MTSPAPRQARLRLYVDESGTAGALNPSDPSARYLCLAGVAIPHDTRHEKFCERFESLKREHLPPIDRDEPCILHREEIVRREYGTRFAVLRDDEKRKRFNEALLKAIAESEFVLYSVVLDKKTHHAAKYREVKDDYHYCMLALLERYCGRLKFRNNVGDVMAEQRGGTQDRALKAAFRELVESGATYFRKDHRTRLTSKEIKLKPKTANILGLQLADLVARDVKRDTLAAFGCGEPPTGFGAELAAVLQPKYNRQLYTGVIRGYGQVLLT